MIEQGDNPNNYDINGQNAIFYAVNLGRLETVKLLKDYESTYDHRDALSQTPLFYAIMSNREDVFKYLLELGVNTKMIDSRGDSPLDIA